MELIHNLTSIKTNQRGCVGAIGNFDGVHLGHQKIFEQVKDSAESLNAEACIITFEPQPKEFFAKTKSPARVTCFREKMQLFSHCNINKVLVIPFNRCFRALTAREFIEEILVNKLALKHLIVGDDFCFGRDLLSDFSQLEKLAKEYKFKLSAAQTLSVNGQRVSSTWVRNSLVEGNFKLVKSLLGRAYRLSGRVVAGQQLGQKLGFPTANLLLKRITIPLSGVYAVNVLIDKEVYQGVANVGWRPTVEVQGEPRLEVHIFDFCKDIYNQYIEVEFVAKVRDEKKFSSLTELKQAIGQDMHKARRLLASKLL